MLDGLRNDAVRGLSGDHALQTWATPTLAARKSRRGRRLLWIRDFPLDDRPRSPGPHPHRPLTRTGRGDFRIPSVWRRGRPVGGRLPPGPVPLAGQAGLRFFSLPGQASIRQAEASSVSTFSSSCRLCTARADAYQDGLDFLYGRLNCRASGDATDPSELLKRRRMRAAPAGRPAGSSGRLHVAGTKGKGSTSAMIAAALTGAGFKTGLFCSPHLQHLEERFSIDGRAAGGDDLVSLVDAVKPTWWSALRRRERGDSPPGADLLRDHDGDGPAPLRPRGGEGAGAGGRHGGPARLDERREAGRLGDHEHLVRPHPSARLDPGRDRPGESREPSKQGRPAVSGRPRETTPAR